jgi:hypothetical protein
MALALLLASVVSACTYEGDVDARPAAAQTSSRPEPSLPTKDRELLSTERSNYAELTKRLARAPGSVLLDDSGPADGPGVGFQKTATVKTAGAHTVTASCVGTETAQIILYQEAGHGSELSLELDCSQVLSQAVKLQKGYVGAQLTRSDPSGPWTGAVAGIRITTERD